MLRASELSLGDVIGVRFVLGGMLQCVVVGVRHRTGDEPFAGTLVDVTLSFEGVSMCRSFDVNHEFTIGR